MLSEEEFEAVVDEALEELPPDLFDKIHNVDIFVEDYPSHEIQEEMGVSRRGLLGFYTGVPQKHRGPYYANVLPDRIFLYKKNLEAICHSREQLKDQIRRTVLHEIGHYFGIDDKRLRELGY
ncbi:MAG TPA: metallopeptidase family protein [bacterium]|nr:metallopeptidase family protein [bacterium]